MLSTRTIPGAGNGVMVSGSRLSIFSNFASIQFLDRLTSDGYFRIFRDIIT